MAREKKGLGSAEVAELMMTSAETPRIVRRRGRFYLYEAGTWRKVEDDEIRHLVLQYARDLPKQPAPTAQFVNAVVEALGHRTWIDGEENAPFPISGISNMPPWLEGLGERRALLVMRNGILDLTPLYYGGRPDPHDHCLHLFATAKADYDYDPDAECRKFMGWLDWFTCGDDDIKTLIAEIICYILLRDLNYHKLFVFLGDGANGKSVLLKTIITLIGEAACSSFALERLGQRFVMSSMLDCAVNICGDVGTSSKAAEGLIKQLVDGSMVESEEKFKQSIGTRNDTRLLFATNFMWRVLDPTDGMWRRLVLIECLAKVQSDKKVNDIERTFIPELPGILNWVLSHAPTLIARGDFSEPKACRDVLRGERSDANSIMAWVDNCITVDGETFVGSKHSVYLKYVGWAEDRGYKAVGSNRFHKEFNRIMKPHVNAHEVKTRVRGGEGVRGWRGFKIGTSKDDGGQVVDVLLAEEEAEREAKREAELEERIAKDEAYVKAKRKRSKKHCWERGLDGTPRATEPATPADDDEIMDRLGALEDEQMATAGFSPVPSPSPSPSLSASLSSE